MGHRSSVKAASVYSIVQTKGFFYLSSRVHLLLTASDALQNFGGEAAVAEAKRVIEYRKFSRRISALDTSLGQILAYLMNLVTYVPPFSEGTQPHTHRRAGRSR